MIVKKRPRKSSSSTAPLGEDQQRDTTTFSIRLTHDERDRLVKAAKIRGWTPTNLIRIATVERAIHILNTAQRTSFPFKSVANEIAERLFKTFHLRVGQDDVDDPYSEDPTIPYQGLPVEKLTQLKDAVRLGGAEFLILILDFCEELTSDRRTDLPEPVDPFADKPIASEESHAVRKSRRLSR